MKVGDLVKFKKESTPLGAISGNVYLVMKTEAAVTAQRVWIYPDPDEGNQPYAFSFYYDYSFEVVSESR